MIETGGGTMMTARALLALTLAAIPVTAQAAETVTYTYDNDGLS